jgi:hypothetical protein
MPLESIMAYVRPEQVGLTIVDAPGRFESCYGSEGWGVRVPPSAPGQVTGHLRS